MGSVNAITYITHFFAPFWRGNVRVLQGEFAEGYADVTAAWEFFSSSGGTLLAPLACSTRAAASMNLGRLEQARALLAEAVEFIDNTDHRMHEAEVHRLLGRYHRRLGDASAAEHSLNKALWVARCQKAKGWELRAAIDLAGLWRDMDKRREAYGLLAPVFDWFTEGLDTQDLRQAAALLTELA